jgi:uncharacterized RmlC-like cupin family protein
MRKVQFLLMCCLLLCGGLTAEAQKVKTTKPQKQTDAAATEREIREVLKSYAEDSLAARREEVANRYDSRGYFALGDGDKRLVLFEDSKKRYLTTWTSPQSFEWKDVSIEVLSPDAAVVTALLDVQKAGVKRTFSFTGLFIKQAGKWVIRVKDESESLPQAEYTISKISGDRSVAGAFKESMTAHAGACIGAHRHTADMHITVLKGRQFILMGDLETARVQVFEVGSSFVIPAGVWHVEWFESESAFEISGIGPMLTERPPTTPRKP